MAADDRVLIEGVVVVVPGIGADELGLLEGRDAVGDGRPADVLELAVDRLEVVGIGGRVLRLGRRPAAQVILPLGPQPDAGRVGEQRHGLGRVAAMDNEGRALATLDRQVDTGKLRHATGEPSRRQHDGAGCDPLASGERDARELVARAIDADDLTRHQLGAGLLRLRAEDRVHVGDVEPALALGAIGAGDDTVEIEIGKALGEAVALEHHGRGALAVLDGGVALDDRTLLGAAQDEVALLLEAAVGVGPEALPQARDEGDAERRQVDVLRRRELQADALRRQCRRGGREGRVALDDGDRARELELVLQEEGDGGAHGATADDDHVEALAGHAPPPWEPCCVSSYWLRPPPATTPAATPICEEPKP